MDPNPLSKSLNFRRRALSSTRAEDLRMQRAIVKNQYTNSAGGPSMANQPSHYSGYEKTNILIQKKLNRKGSPSPIMAKSPQ
jgi:hypothetical protein